MAGETVKLFYNPDTTALRGRPEIWIRGSFNRSRHPEKFGPLRMEPLVRGGNGFNVVELQVGFQNVLLPSLEAVLYVICVLESMCKVLLCLDRSCVPTLPALSPEAVAQRKLPSATILDRLFIS